VDLGGRGHGRARAARQRPLADGDGVLLDPLALTVEDSTSRGEQRWQTIGVNSFGELMIVVWTNRGSDVRLISVRKPEPKERRDYETSS